MCILVEGCARGAGFGRACGVEVCCADGAGAGCVSVSVKNLIRFEPFLGWFYAGRMLKASSATKFAEF